MASSTKTRMPEEAASKSKMDYDLDGIGAHCQMEYCRGKDLLPIKCESCYLMFCGNHQLETNHACKRIGDAARRRTGIDTVTTTSLLSSPQYTRCFLGGCKEEVDTSKMKGVVDCTSCRHVYCLPHRLPESHACPKQKTGPATAAQTQRDRGLAALDRFKSWGLSKKAALPIPKLPVSEKKAAAQASVARTNNLKLTAKGDAKVLQDKRVYLYVEAEAKTTTSKFPSGKFFYSKDLTIGRVLDIAAKALQVENVNNRVPGEDQKLRVYHVELGRVLDFSEKVGDVLQTGNTIVLLRGVGTPVPDLITL